MAQQANPNVAGQSDPALASPAIFSTVVSKKPLGSFSSTPTSVPLQAAASPDVRVDDEHRSDEQHHLDKAERAEPIEGNGPRVQEDDFDVEDDEQHRGQVELHRKVSARGLR